jgi:type II secretory pathway pseudopilin PulG
MVARRTGQTCKGAARAAGYTYFGVLFLVAVLGAVMGVGGEVWRTTQQREKEQELLFIGNQFRLAIGRYYEQSPPPVKRFPPNLEALLRDQRVPGVQRYLRKLYRDPMTGDAEWGLVPAADGGISGVYSLSDGRPIKTANFAGADRDFEGKERYSDWVFYYQPRVGKRKS